MAKIIQLPTTTYYHRTFLPGHQADVRYFPRPTPIYHGAKYIDSDNITRFSRLTGYALPGGFMSFTDRLSPRIISLAISFWQEHEKRDNEWVPRFQQFPPARQIDYLRIFFSHHSPRNFFEKATETTARRITALAKHDLYLARQIFWRTGELSPLDFDQAVFYTLGNNPLLQAQLLVARGVTQGDRLLTETFENRVYDDLEAARILSQGKGLTPEEKQVLQQIERHFFQNRGGTERAFVMRRLVVWQTRLNHLLRWEQSVDYKISVKGGD
ncbi:MAG: hypothetical protein KKD13_00210, partial [Candidatus Margulisbacteria bacterium]|nr:hypothetical protein [Candidatus Margulisiibacteriota bacterium]